MLSLAKHLVATRMRPFAAAQGDTRGEGDKMGTAHAIPSPAESVPLYHCTITVRFIPGWKFLFVNQLIEIFFDNSVVTKPESVIEWRS